MALPLGGVWKPRFMVAPSSPTSLPSVAMLAQLYTYRQGPMASHAFHLVPYLVLACTVVKATWTSSVGNSENNSDIMDELDPGGREYITQVHTQVR